jgi:SulP family sulfate permease
MNVRSWLPKSVECLQHYDRRTFGADLLAGVTVGLVALPLAMAFAISSGVPPQAGLYCAVVAGFLISALGGSRTQIGGPTGAFVVVVSGIVARYGLDGLLTCTIMAGVLLIVLGTTGMGTAVDFILRPVIVGLPSVAVLIASTQIKDSRPDIPHARAFVPRMIQTSARPTSPSPGLAAAALIVADCNRLIRRAGHDPGAVRRHRGAAVLLSPVDTTAAAGGAGRAAALLDAALRPGSSTSCLRPRSPWPRWARPSRPWRWWPRMTGDRHNPNVELVAQGVANIASPLFGGLPATGAIARTATSIRTGARTPVAGMIHALTLLAVLVFAAPYARFVPLAVLSAILLVVAYHMGDWEEIPELLKLSRADISVWLATFALTVFADLTVAVEVGMILAALLFIRKVAATTTVSEVTEEDIEEGRVHVLQDKLIPDYVALFRIHGPFLFGSTDKLDTVADRINEMPEIVVLRLRNMTAIDATGIRALEDLAHRLHAAGRTLLLCGAREQPARLMHMAEFDAHIGTENICANVQAALERAKAVHEAAKGVATSPPPG